MEVSKELRIDIEKNQTLLKVAIEKHQVLILKLKNDPECTEIRFKLKEAQNHIITIALEQKVLVQKLRKELRVHQKNAKINLSKSGVEDRKTNLTNILKQTKKHSYNSRSASTSSSSISDDSQDELGSPVARNLPLLPHEMSQPDFLNRLGLCTPEVFKELQNKRVERKRRSTANPHFLYGNRWDQTTKRKKTSYLISTMSPPQTRQSSLKNRQRAELRGSSPGARSDSRSSSPVNKRSLGLNIPNLPSGLTIERVDSSRSSPESTTGSLCDVCHGVASKHCVACGGKPNSGMTVLASFVSAEVKEKIQEKKTLQEKNKTLNEELTELEERKTELKTSISNQEENKKRLLDTHNITKQNIQRLIDFVNVMKGSQAAVPSPVAVSQGS